MFSIEYPYIPDKYGIPFAEFLFEGNINRKIRSGSGRPLYVWADNFYLDVQDDVYSIFSMEGRCINRAVSFILQTTNFKNKTGISLPLVKERHPDMYAGYFVKLAIDYFQDRGQQIDYFKAEWQPDSINFKQYFENKTVFRPASHAAKRTWTGIQAQKNGFTRVASLTNTFDSEGDRVVRVVFAR